MKEKRRSNEKRKEKSRDAARCRRSRETDIFTELAAALPVPQADAAHLDKASVMRLAIAYLKTRTLMDAVPKPLAKPEISPEMDELFLKGLDGFVLVLDNNGDMVYLSPNVKDYLGIAQMDLMGQSVFDYSHPCDHDEIRESLSLKASEISDDHPCNFFLRLKCTLTSKGRKVNLKSASYKVIHCTGRLFAHPFNSINNNNNNNNGSDSESQEESNEKEPGVSLVVVASPVPHPSNIEIPLGKYTFLSKHNLNMKFTYADDKLAEFLGWESNELVGQSIFEFHHALDNLSLDKSFKSLFSKGQCETMAYRFLNKNGGYAWVVTQATLIHCSRLQKPLSVVCVNYLLSGVECEDEVYSVRQLEARASQLKQEVREEEQHHQQEKKLHSARPAPLEPRKPLVEKPITVTASIFRHKDQDSKPIISEQQAVNPRPRYIGKENNEQNNKAKPNIPVCEVTPNLHDSQSLPETPNFVGDLAIQEPNPSLYESHLKNQTEADEEYDFATERSIVSCTKEIVKTNLFMFKEDQKGVTTIKDEPEDLTALAPKMDTEDILLSSMNPPLSEMLDEFILNSTHCPLSSTESPGSPADLTATVCNTSITGNLNCNNNNNPLKDVEYLLKDVDYPLKDYEQTILGDTLRKDFDTSNGDPFIYRDSPSRCSLGTDLHSPTLTKSPEDSADSLSSPNSSGCLSEDEMLMLSISDVMADDELVLRASYIPMSDQDEALKLLISDDMVMWGPSQSNDKKNKWLTDAVEENANSSLAQLLTNETSSNKMKDHAGTLVNPTQVLGQISLKTSTKDSTAERGCTNKRTHSTYSPKSSQENKRAKYNDNETTNNNNNFSNLENILSSSVQNSQLLQQLVSQQQTPKNRNWQDQLTTDARNNRNNTYSNNIYDDTSRCRLTDDNGDYNNIRKNTVFQDDASARITSQQQQQQQRPLQQQQQSNSVLMNLLVSGCDMQGIQNQLQKSMNNFSLHMNVDEQLQTVPQWSNVTPLNTDQLSPMTIDAKQQQQQQLRHHQQQQQQQQQTCYESMSYSNEDLFGFINSSSMLNYNDELLCALDPNLV